MQIIIDIPEEVINMCKDNEVTTVKLSAEYFRNGIILPNQDEVLENFKADDLIVICDGCGRVLRIKRRNANANSNWYTNR